MICVYAMCVCRYHSVAYCSLLVSKNGHIPGKQCVSVVWCQDLSVKEDMFI